MSKKRRVFVIGAGMSSECGAPLLGQFFDQQFAGYANKRTLRAILEFITAIFPAGSKPNIEEILTLVDTAIISQDSLAGYRIADLSNMKVKIIEYILEVLSGAGKKVDDFFELRVDEFTDFFKEENKQRSGFTVNLKRLLSAYHNLKNQKLGNKLGRYGCEVEGFLNTYFLLSLMLRDSDGILSLNYDLYLDTALSLLYILDEHFSSNLKVYRNPQSSLEFNKFKPGDPCFQRVYIPRSRGDNGKEVFVSKFHGAMNVAYCRSCKREVQLFPGFISRSWKQIQKAQSKRQRLCCALPDLVPNIVPPTWIKSYGDYEMECQYLAISSEVVFLGYSFSESDYKIRYLFNVALSKRNGKGWDKIVVVDPCINNVLGRYERFFGKVAIFEGKSSEYLKSIYQEGACVLQLP